MVASAHACTKQSIGHVKQAGLSFTIGGYYEVQRRLYEYKNTP